MSTVELYTELVAPYLDRALEPGTLDSVRSAYTEVLTSDGVVFPDANLKQAQKLWSAYAASERGAVEPSDDGATVDLTDFDRDSIAATLQEGGQALNNEKRLDALTELTLFSRAGSLMLATVANQQSPISRFKLILGELNQLYKQYVQANVVLEGWGRPWEEIIENGFEGQPLAVPFTAAQIPVVLDQLSDPVFTDLDEKYFGGIFLLRINTQNLLQTSTDLDDSQAAIASLAGIFYPRFPEAATQFLQGLIKRGQLPQDEAWQKQFPEVAMTAWKLLDR